MKNILVLVLLATFAVGQNVKQLVPVQTGRYQLINLDHGTNEAPFITSLLLDTTTGKTWLYEKFPDGVSAWVPTHKVDTAEEQAAFLNNHQKPDTKE
jgi:hypothetical protein